MVLEVVCEYEVLFLWHQNLVPDNYPKIDKRLGDKVPA